MVGLALALVNLPGHSATSEPADPMVAQIVRELQEWVKRDFAVPERATLDQALRSSAERLSQEQITRVGLLVQTWVKQEAAALPATSLNARELGARTTARYINEMALWQLDTTGEAYDRLLLQAMMNPGLCAAQSGQPPFAEVLLAIQHLPPDSRRLALDAQRELLARWGQRRSSVPERPLPSMMEQAQQAVRLLASANRPATDPPLPPLLAWVMLSTPSRRIDDDVRCSLLHWWLQRETAAERTDKATFVPALRYASLMDPLERFRLTADTNDTAATYPKVAVRFGVEGKVRVRGAVRAGTMGLEQARIASRQITVPGVRDVRPVVFETVLDEASLARAQTVQPTAGAPGQEIEVEFAWRLEP